MRRVLGSVLASAFMAVLLWPAPADAVPTFTRQTGMTCTQCHVSFGAPVPSFTMAGKKFRMNGYRMPSIMRSYEAGEPGEASGRRLNIGAIPHWSHRYQSSIASQRKSPGAESAGPVTTDPINRLSWFPGGAISDHLGVWVEFYLIPGFGFPGQEWSLGTISMDEYDLRYVDISPDRTLGFGINNQSIQEISGFGPWPIYITNYFSRGGFIGWAHPNFGNVFAYGLFNDRVFATVAASPGEDNLNWENGKYFGGHLGYAAWNEQDRELWFNIFGQFGDDGIPITSGVIPTQDKTWRTVDRIEGISGTRAFDNRQPYTSQDMGDYVRLEPGVHLSLVGMDNGMHTLQAEGRLTYANETYADNSEITHSSLGVAFRYLYDFTWGLDFAVKQSLGFSFTDVAGTEIDVNDQDFLTNWRFSYRPAMNFILNFQWGESESLVLDSVGDSERGWNWFFGVDYMI